jgi:hypothetical protein
MDEDLLEPNYAGFMKAKARTYWLAAHISKYKGGAFMESITESTTATEALTLFIDSPLTDEEEKSAFRVERANIASVNHSSTMAELVNAGSGHSEMCRIFNTDAGKRRSSIFLN